MNTAETPFSKELLEDVKPSHLPKRYFPPENRTSDAGLILDWLKQHPFVSSISQVPVAHRDLTEKDFHWVDGDLQYFKLPLKASVLIAGNDVQLDYAHLVYRPGLGSFCLKGEIEYPKLTTIPLSQIERIQLL